MWEVIFVLLLLLVSIPGVRADASVRSRSSSPPTVVSEEIPVLVSDEEEEADGTGSNAGRPGSGRARGTTSRVFDREIVSIEIGTWNIQSGRNGRLETALRALKMMGLDLALLTEVKLTDGIHT